MRVLIAPLNWGLGHASRCIPLVADCLRRGDEVTLAGDGDSLLLLRKHFPTLPYHRLAPLTIRYSAGNRQVGAMLCMLPRLLVWAIRDHRMLRRLCQEQTFDRIISDNRFGCYSRTVPSVYITHQLQIPLPKPWQGLEPLARRLHAAIISRYTACIVPDYAEPERSLAGRLSHPSVRPPKVQYVGPLSRFSLVTEEQWRRHHLPFAVVAVLSGPEPQRSLLEEAVLKEWLGREEEVLIVRGLPGKPPMQTLKQNITMVPYVTDDFLVAALRQARLIIARSGYTSVMDFALLGVSEKTRWVPTPGQPEQEYLATRLNENKAPT